MLKKKQANLKQIKSFNWLLTASWRSFRHFKIKVPRSWQNVFYLFSHSDVDLLVCFDSLSWCITKVHLSFSV